MSKRAHLVKSMDVNKPVKMNLIMKKLEEDKSDFLEAEDMGIQCPQRCQQCSNCSNCSISAQHSTRKVQAELILLEQHMDCKVKKMMVKYPIVKDSIIKDLKVLSDRTGAGNPIKTIQSQTEVQDWGRTTHIAGNLHKILHTKPYHSHLRTCRQQYFQEDNCQGLQ